MSTRTLPAVQRRRRPAARRGAMLIFIVFLMVGFIAATALMVGVAHMQLARTELRSATDAAARAAAQELASTQNVESARLAGIASAQLNLVNNEPLILRDSDFEFGHSSQNESGRFIFRLGETPINSVRVVGRRTEDSASGAIPLFMGNLLDQGTFEPQQSSVATYVERDVCLVVDRSGSMDGRKWRDLRDSVEIFTDTLRDTDVEERVGLASYSTYSTQDVQLTDNLNAIDRKMRQLYPSGWTSISRGMESGAVILRNGRDNVYVEKTLIVMTDGLHNRGAEPIYIARELADEGVTIHTITFGRNADRNRMRQIANVGHGRYYHANSGSELRSIYRQIALSLSTMLTE